MPEEICSICGLPKTLCVCGVIEKEAQKIKISVERRKWDKPITIIEGITNNAKELSSQLKSKLACGGTLKEGRIELQGDHRKRLRDMLNKLGYADDQLEFS
jgi:translation initiation factor 1